MIGQITFPTKTDYQVAMQNPHLYFNDPDLKGCSASIKKNGLPRGYSGGYAVVYKVRDKSSKEIALRLFTIYTSDSAQRYANLSNFIRQNQSSYFVGFEFINDAITVNKNKHPALKMEWIDGIGVGDYIGKNLTDKNSLQLLMSKLLVLFQFLLANSIAHGDLSHTNVIVTNKGDLKLIDYDGMFCQDTKHQKTSEIGLPHFQHPDRRIEHYSEKMDHFSMWIIYASILILIEDQSYYNGLDCIIFTSNDFRNPNQSVVLQKLRSNSNKTLQFLSEFIIKISENNYNDIPEFTLQNTEKLRGLNLFVSGSKSIPFNTAPINSNWKATQKPLRPKNVVLASNNAGIPNWKELIKKKIP